MPSGKIPTLKAECQTCETNMIKFIKHDLTTKNATKIWKNVKYYPRPYLQALGKVLDVASV